MTERAPAVPGRLTPSGTWPTFRDVLNSRRCLIAAHRGASAYAPENTLAAFDLALGQGAEVLELDVHLTADDQVVVIHDARVDRTTDGRGEVRELSLEAIRALDAGTWYGERWRGARIPTLGEVLRRYVDRALLDIELKAGITMGFASLDRSAEPVDDAVPGVAEAIAQMRGSLMAEDPAVTIPLAGGVLAEVQEAAALSRVVISGFAAGALAWVHAGWPQVATQWAVVSADIGADAAFAARAGFDVISPQAYAATAANVAHAHAAGLAVHIYAGDEEETMARLIALGVDAVKTGSPDRLRALLPAHRPD